MPRLVVDLHLHSRYSIGTSPALDLAALAEGARRIGLDLIAAPDFTHPGWLNEMRAHLTEAGDGVYRLKFPGSPARPGTDVGNGGNSRPASGTGTGGPKEEGHGRGRMSVGGRAQSALHVAAPAFVFATEVSCVWTAHGRGRRVHLLVVASGLGAVERMNARLGKLADLASDGRPLLNVPARQVAAEIWEADERCLVIPAHVWTPWYGLYGSKSGFESIEDCFGDLAPRIVAIETGLSSDPAMNWRVADLDTRAIVSFSDAHSVPSMGREATVLDCAPDFPSVAGAIRAGRIVETLEFHPAHGKYHLDGHRKCGVRLTPDESAAASGRCPRCGRKATLGVLNRVGELASRPEGIASAPDDGGIVRGPAGRPPFRHVVPLRQVLSHAFGVGPTSSNVVRAWEQLTSGLGGEISVLTTAAAEDIERVAGDRVASTVLAARGGRVEIDPGYDGEYGTVRVLT